MSCPPGKVDRLTMRRDSIELVTAPARPASAWGSIKGREPYCRHRLLAKRAAQENMSTSAARRQSYAIGGP